MEYWDIVDENGRFLYTAPADIKCKHGEYHFAAEVWPVNPHGEILIQKRSSTVPDSSRCLGINDWPNTVW